jgi:hypothetical protein
METKQEENLEFNHSSEFLSSVSNHPVILGSDAIILFGSRAPLDYFSIPVIEKIYKIGGDYTKYIENILKVYYTPTSNMDDFVLDYPFWKLVEKQFEGMLILQLREIITMLVFRLSSYKVTGSNSKTKEAIENPEIKLLGESHYIVRGLRINKSIITPFNTKYNIKTGVAEFNKKYGCILSSCGINVKKNEPISIGSVNEVINYIKSGNLFVRVEIEEFSLCYKRVTKMISCDLKKVYSYGACILACYLLGCPILMEGDAVKIGITLNFSKDD